MPTQVLIGKATLRLVTGDIADQETDAVVTAAHWRLNKGTGTDGTIHTKGGPRIYEECLRIGGCPVGDAVITTGGDLRARHVIHAVGPVWRGGDEYEPVLLASAYRRSLEVAARHGLRSISFPSISTGAFVYPIRQAAPLALGTIIAFLERERHDLDEVRMVLYTRENDKAFTVFAEALEKILSQRAGYGAAEPRPTPDAGR
ncbi:MAG TPA: macro domain-containing protein [Urbifossiella sp.]|nr:macro domain-containing protein [Urbifossiella sp.]